MKSLNLNSYAKLNLYLRVLGRRDDNYHSIITLFERIDLCDRIGLRVLPQRQIRIVLSGRALPSGRGNLVYRAASLLRREFGVRRGVEISIKKLIPVSAGLGGGSSDAATVLTGLNKLWGLNLSVRQLAVLARGIGSDVAFFLYNCSFACGTCRGDEVKVLELPVKLWHVIVVPRVKVRSRAIYSRIQTRQMAGSTPPFQQGNIGAGQERAGLTVSQSEVRILRSALLKKDFSKIGRKLFNSLEQIAVLMHPVIKEIRLVLSNLGLKAVLMSGSGPAVFGLVSSRKEAYAVVRQLKANLRNWDVFVAKTV